MPDRVGLHQAQIATFRYDFDEHAGAIGAIELDGSNVNGIDAGGIPDDAVMLHAWVEANESLASGGAATVKLGVTGDDDCFIAATAFDNAAFVAGAATALTAGIPKKVDAADGVKVLATVAAAALTAGSFDVHVAYLPGKA